MKVFYINLDSESERRKILERNFADCRRDGWSLSRFCAMDIAHVNATKVSGSLRPAEKACYLSHKDLLASQLDDQESIMVLEDDACFGKHTCAIVDTLVSDKRPQQPKWDILFTDIAVTNVQAMARLINRRHTFPSDHQISLLDLCHYPFAGATAYIVNGESKGKLVDLLRRCNDLDTPFDLYLRQSIWEKAIAGFFLFPFITSLSEYAESSSIQLTGDRARDLVCSTFRRMTWVERNLDQQKPRLDRLRENLCDRESALFSIPFAAMISKNNPFGWDC